MTKMTYAVALDVAINAVADEEVKEKLIALKAQIENEGLKSEIVSALTALDRPLCIKEIMVEVPAIAGLTNQRVTHLLTDLVKSAVLERTVVKKVPYFAIATA